MKDLLLLFIGFLLITSCIYDPPEGVLYIKNNSDSTIYTYISCDDSIHLRPSLILFELVNDKVTDASRKHKNDTIYPQYRIESKNEGGIVGFGAQNNRKIRCGDKRLTIFFITEKMMKVKSWEEIAEKQLFIKKVILTQEELDKNNWHVNY